MSIGGRADACGAAEPSSVKVDWRRQWLRGGRDVECEMHLALNGERVEMAGEFMGLGVVAKQW